MNADKEPGSRHFTVVGAGIVGVCTALYLQREGYRVTLIDRSPPGRGCSYGNAGVIQSGASVPVATPDVVRSVPRMLLDPDGPLVIRWQHLPTLIPYLIRFLAAARPARVEEISKALAEILRFAIGSYEPLFSMAKVEDLIESTGELYVYESEAAFQSGWKGHEMRRRRGVRVEEIPVEDLRQLEPDLAPIFKRCVFLPDSIRTTDPFRLTQALAENFTRNGGEFRQETLINIEMGSAGPAAIVTDTGRHAVSELVITTGAYSRQWARRLGSYVPLDTERGYHLMLPEPGVKIGRPVLSGDYRFGLAPMTEGLRLAGTAELAKLDAPPNYRRTERLLQVTQRMLPGLNNEGHQKWMGHRPSTPDSLPVICRSPNYASVYFAFGHGHLGLTLGAATGRIIADMAAGRRPPLEVAPYDIRRFKRGF